MKIFLLSLGLVFCVLISYSQKKKTNPMHKVKPTETSESPLSDDFMDKLVNSDYTKGLDSLKTHVAGHKVINSATCIWIIIRGL